MNRPPANNRRPQRKRSRLVFVLRLFRRRRRRRRLSGCIRGRRSRLTRDLGLRLRGGCRRRRYARFRLTCGRRSIMGFILPSILPSPGRALFNRCARAVAVRRRRPRRIGFAFVITAQLIGLVFVDRAGVGNFFGDPEFVQLVDDLARLYFQLPRQFIDSNLTHIKVFRFICLFLLVNRAQLRNTKSPPILLPGIDVLRKPAARPILPPNGPPWPHPRRIPPIPPSYHSVRQP